MAAQSQILILTLKKARKNLIKTSHSVGSSKWSVDLEALLLSSTIALQMVGKNKTKMWETFLEMSQKLTTKCSLNNQVLVINTKKRAKILTFGIHQRPSHPRCRRNPRVTGVLLPGASNRVIRVSLRIQIHPLAPELELRLTEVVRTLSEEQMELGVCHLTGEEAAVAEQLPRMTTGAETTISHGWRQKKRRKKPKLMLSICILMALALILI